MWKVVQVSSAEWALVDVYTLHILKHGSREEMEKLADRLNHPVDNHLF